MLVFPGVVSSLANMCIVPNYVAGCLIFRCGGALFYNQHAYCSCSKYCDRATPFSWKKRWQRNVWWLFWLIALVAVKTGLFSKASLEFLPALLLLRAKSALFVIGFLVLKSGLFLSWIVASAHDIQIVFCVLKWKHARVVAAPGELQSPCFTGFNKCSCLYPVFPFLSRKISPLHLPQLSAWVSAAALHFGSCRLHIRHLLGSEVLFSWHGDTVLVRG